MRYFRWYNDADVGVHFCIAGSVLAQVIQHPQSWWIKVFGTQWDVPVLLVEQEVSDSLDRAISFAEQIMMVNLLPSEANEISIAQITKQVAQTWETGAWSSSGERKVYLSLVINAVGAVYIHEVHNQWYYLAKTEQGKTKSGMASSIVRAKIDGVTALIHLHLTAEVTVDGNTYDISELQKMQ